MYTEPKFAQLTHAFFVMDAYCSLDKGMACARHIQLLTHT